MVTQSGLFGSGQTTNETIDNLSEVSEVVDSMGTGTGTDNAVSAFSLLLQHYAYMDQRVRLLTYAVVALAAFLVAKELTKS